MPDATQTAFHASEMCVQMPERIVGSDWSHDQHTKDAHLEGMGLVAPDVADAIEVETDASLNLLLHLDGASSVTGFRDRISGWDGGDGGGPLLIISNFTNVGELTEFRVHVGEILILDQDRDNRMLGTSGCAARNPMSAISLWRTATSRRAAGRLSRH